ncbi:hypothetical protein BDV93DRAFT_509660 [Ceratobasidium sp. AG-I]|nr:hypothetical protein BDV93DRAFT_509660 [Ceratobasidium sp. AG-I]
MSGHGVSWRVVVDDLGTRQCEAPVLAKGAEALRVKLGKRGGVREKEDVEQLRPSFWDVKVVQRHIPEGPISQSTHSQETTSGEEPGRLGCLSQVKIDLQTLLSKVWLGSRSAPDSGDVSSCSSRSTPSGALVVLEGDPEHNPCSGFYGVLLELSILHKLNDVCILLIEVGSLVDISPPDITDRLSSTILSGHLEELD